MRRLVVLFAAVLLAGCGWFVDDSEFVLRNETSSSLTATWVQRDDGVVRSMPSPVRPGESATIAVGRMLTVPELSPGLFFSRITVDALVDGEWRTAYSRHPVNDAEWRKDDEKGSVYLLVLTDADLTAVRERRYE